MVWPTLGSRKAKEQNIIARMISDNSGRGNLKETRRCTFMYNMASHCSMCNLEVTDDGEAVECDECWVKKYGQLVTTPSDTTV